MSRTKPRSKRYDVTVFLTVFLITAVICTLVILNIQAENRERGRLFGLTLDAEYFDRSNDRLATAGLETFIPNP